MPNFKLILAYDGTPFHGWQIQPGLATVQGLLSDAIHRTVGERVLPQGSGRTDTGVHALGQVASFTLHSPIPAANLHHALNRCLPPSIRILSVESAPPSFHARHSARQKTYEYRIFPLKAAPIEPGPSNLVPSCQLPQASQSHRDAWEVKSPDRICPPVLAPTVWPCPWPLDLAALIQAATQVLGTHDFTSFAASDPDLTTRSTPGLRAHAEPDAPSNIRTLTHSQWRCEDDLILYRVTATGFLHHMVRNLVGTFVQCGAHRLSPGEIPALLAARNRAAAGPTAPPHGLFLVSVDYAVESATDNLHPATGNSL